MAVGRGSAQRARCFGGAAARTHAAQQGLARRVNGHLQSRLASGHEVQEARCGGYFLKRLFIGPLVAIVAVRNNHGEGRSGAREHCQVKERRSLHLRGEK